MFIALNLHQDRLWGETKQQEGKDARKGGLCQYLAMITIYLPIKLDFDRTNRFQVRVQKRTMLINEQNAK